MLLPSFSRIRYTYVRPDARFVVAMSKTHCWPDGSQRKPPAGPRPATASCSGGAPGITAISEKSLTTPGVPIDTPRASHTRKRAGTVRPALNTLVPPAAIGARIWWPGSPAHASPAGA